MKNRLLAVICMIAIFISCITVGFFGNVSASAERYQVGYAIKDINPWLDYEDHSKGIQPGLFNLTGNQNDELRPLETLFDDNGDGVRGEGDGIYTTATAVTDSFGKTIIYITIDSLQGYSAVTSDARAAIVEQLGSNVISGDQIMVNGSHSHSSAPFSSLRNKAGAKGEFYNYVIAQITAAAVEAYNDRAPAEMSKGTVDAKNATAALGYNDGKGFHMNAIRHYETTVTNKYDSSEQKKYVTWSGDTLDKQSEYPFVTSGANKKTHMPVEESNNDMHILLFEFPDNAEKQPIVMVNWRAHTTMNSGVEMKSLSSDYVNGLRTTMAKYGYRAAFLQGAAGNVVTAAKSGVWSAYPEYKDWMNQVDAEVGSSKRDANKTFIYGRMLAEIAKYCIEDSGNMSTQPAGKIRNIQLTWKGELQPYTDGHLAAALETKELEADGRTIEYPFRYEYEGETYILNSNYHRNAVINRSNANASYTNLELNAITLGSEVAFVTAPNELADKFHVYSEGETYSDDKNDWNNLINTETYGTPFVLGYTNDGRGYIASWLDHTMNSQIYTDITGFADDGEEFFDPGTYESNTSRFAQGQGEELVKQFGKMLDILSDGYRSAYCEACKETVEWEPILKTHTGQLRLGTGHYYLYEDIPVETVTTNRFSVKDGDTLCLDLNGYKIETASRTFYSTGKCKINISDCVGTGHIISYSGGNNVGGGAITASNNSVINIFGGTIQFIRPENPDVQYETGNGAVIASSGIVNMYGGKLIGGELKMSSFYNSMSTSNGCGATVYLSGSGKLNVYGGQIIAGSCPEGGRGDCVYLASRTNVVTLYNDACVDEIYCSTNTGTQLVISGTYTGRAAVNTGAKVTNGTKLATLKSADISGAILTCSANSIYALVASGNNLVVRERTEGAALVYHNYTVSVYDSLPSALNAYESGLIILLHDVLEKINIDKDVYMNLNGYSIRGAVTVAEKKVLSCMDSNTDDYDVADGKYGRLVDVNGVVVGIPEESDLAADGYLMVTEADGTSFHRVNLQLTAMTLRPEEAGLYYKSNFAGDEVVARNVDTFGVALSASEEPDAGNMETACKYSWFDNFTKGANGNAGDVNSTLLKGVLKQTNPDFINDTNAARLIYGRAYIKLNDGGYMFGASAARTFRQQLEDVNDIWSSLTEAQCGAVVDMCTTYRDLVKGWDVAGILSYGAENDGVLKIFALGDSYTVDAMHLLYEVYKAENPDKQVVLGYGYKDGATLADHVLYMNADEPVYTYCEIDADGTPITTNHVTIGNMLCDENWDVITLQQGSVDSGIVDTYTSAITQLYGYAKSDLGYTPAYAWNMTWSYPEITDSNAAGFDKYGSQEEMFNGIVTAVKDIIITNADIDYVMPVGLAVQNARTYYINRTDLHRDVYGHLNDYARLMAAYVWYCELEGAALETIKLDSVPEKLTSSYTDGDLVLTDMQKQVLIQSVNNAILTRKDNTFAVMPVDLAQ